MLRMAALVPVALGLKFTTKVTLPPTLTVLVAGVVVTVKSRWPEGSSPSTTTRKVELACKLRAAFPSL